VWRRAVSKEKTKSEAIDVQESRKTAMTEEKPAAAQPSDAKPQAVKSPAGRKGSEAKAPKEGSVKPAKVPKTGKEPKGQKPPSETPAAEKSAYRDPPGYVPRLKKLFREVVTKAMQEEFGYKTTMQIPCLNKIVVSMGIGEAIANKKLLESATAELGQITGMKAVKTKAKKSIAQFKVRKGMEVGAMVTLRGNHMYEFLDRLINVAMPRIKDFRGANPNAFDGHGNYSLGVTEQIIFPEIDYDKIERISGMNVAIVTTARTDAEARSLLGRLGMPFRK
jgi:large subunit ribosomal protein L5